MRFAGWLPLVGVVLAIAPGFPLARAEVRIGVAAPLTGPYAWAGVVTERGAQVAVADLNAGGGVLGQQIELVSADDYCDAEQTSAAAHKLVAAGVVAVFGHQCSGAAIPASRIYSDARILMVASEATNPRLTEQGFTNVFRMVGRDDLQGRIAGDLLAERWGDSPSRSSTTGRLTAKALPRRPGSDCASVASPRRCSRQSSPARPTIGTLSRKCRRSASKSCTSAATSTRRR